MQAKSGTCVEHLLKTVFLTKITCLNCQHHSYTFEDTISITLTIRKEESKNLENSVYHSLKKQEVPGCYCRNCGKSVRSEKRLTSGDFLKSWYSSLRNFLDFITSLLGISRPLNLTWKWNYLLGISILIGIVFLKILSLILRQNYTEKIQA